MSLFIVGVDPGKMCGIACCYETSDGSYGFRSYALPSDDAIDTVKVWLYNGPTPSHETYLACERYTIGQRTVKMTRQPRALEVIGALRKIAFDEGARFELQDVSSAKKMGGPELLKRLGWYQSGRDMDHANDAASHVVLLLSQRFPTVFKQLVTLV